MDSGQQNIYDANQFTLRRYATGRNWWPNDSMYNKDARRQACTCLLARNQYHVYYLLHICNDHTRTFNSTEMDTSTVTLLVYRRNTVHILCGYIGQIKCQASDADL